MALLTFIGTGTFGCEQFKLRPARVSCPGHSNSSPWLTFPASSSASRLSGLIVEPGAPSHLFAASLPSHARTRRFPTFLSTAAAPGDSAPEHSTAQAAAPAIAARTCLRPGCSLESILRAPNESNNDQ